MRIPFRLPAAGSRAFDVVGVGENSVDLVAVVAEYPARGSKQRLQRFARHPGGQTATALVACRRLGLRARYVGTFGSDDLGRVSRESLAAESIDLAYARDVPGATNRFALIIVDAQSGQRTVLWDRDPALATAAADVPREAVASGRVLLVDATETAVSTEAARLAREAGVVTVIDVEKVAPRVHELLPHIDAIITAEPFPTALTGQDDLGRALRTIARDFHAPLVCVTLGEGGSLALCGGLELRTPAFRVDCVDTTGAGDVFRAGFIAACIQSPESSVEDVLAFANAAAALNCRALGARGALPTVAEIEQLLGRRDM